MRAVLKDADAQLLELAKGRPGRAIALKAQGIGVALAETGQARTRIARGESAALLNNLFDTLSGESFEKLAGVMELAGEWARGLGVEQGSEQWADAWSAIETIRAEAEGLDMDPRHALARAASVLDRAGGGARR